MPPSLTSLECFAARADELAQRLTGLVSFPSSHSTDKDLQASYLLSHALAAIRSAGAYWLLRQHGRNHDAQDIARTLLERILCSRYGERSPKDALTLMCRELNDKKKYTAKFIEESMATSGMSEIQEMQKLISRYENEIGAIADLAGIVAPKGGMNYYEIAKETGVNSIHRSAYFHLSMYSHAVFDTSRPEEFNREPAATSDQIALISPVLCGAALCEAELASYPLGMQDEVIEFMSEVSVAAHGPLP